MRTALIAILAAFAISGCASKPGSNAPVMSSRFAHVTLVSCTNCVVYVTVSSDGGGGVALGYPDSNTVKTVADAYMTGSGIGAAGTVLGAAAKGAGAVEAIKASK